MQNKPAVASPVSWLEALPWPVPDETWSQAYALIDSSVLDYDDLAEKLADLHQEPCIPGGVGPSVQTPVLIDLRTCSEEQIANLYVQHYWRDELEGRRQTAIMGARIESTRPIKEVAQQIANCLTIKEQGQRSLWRLWDAQVFAHLGWLLRGEQLSALLGGIIDRWQINWLGQYYSLDANTLPPVPQAVLAHLPDAQQVTLLPYFNEVNRFIKHLLIAHEPQDPERFAEGKHTPQNPRRYASPYRSIFSRVAAGALFDAEKILHLRNDDITRYAEYVLNYGLDFTNHKTLRPLWEPLRAGQMNFTQLISHFSSLDLWTLEHQKARQPFYLTLTETTRTPRENLP